MQTRMRLFDLLSIGLILSVNAPLAFCQRPQAVAQSYPSKPIRLIVTNPPGGGTDLVARMIAPKLGDALAQQVVVDNRFGASGIIGADLVAKAAPDGYTLVAISSQHAIIPSFFATVPWSLTRDFSPITQMTSQPYMLGVNAGLPVKSVGDLIALAKAKPGQLNYASGGNGTAPHLGGELFKIMTGTNMVHVPYQGGGPAVIALVAGEAVMLLSSVPTTMPQVKAGKIRALGLTGAKRSPALPEIPTVAEGGVPGYEVTSWYGVLAPANTPRSIVSRLNSEITRSLAHPDFKERLTGDGTELVGSAPEAFGAFLVSEIGKWAKVVKVSGARMD